MSNPGYWCPVIASSELGTRPLARIRFGERLVFWRSGRNVVCMPDRCPHRSAALSLGRINLAAGTLACPFHGLEFAADGSCVGVPGEADPGLCEEFRVEPRSVREADGYIWLWRGPDAGKSESLPRHPALSGLRYGESRTVWPAHYTRCIENVCDYSHLPFVHRWTIGAGNRGKLIHIEMEDVPGGFRAHLLQDGERHQCLEFLYPNLWLLMISERLMLSAVFAPLDDDQTVVYGRTYYRMSFPGIGLLMKVWTRFSQFLVFREDWPIVASQLPGDVNEAQHERLLPSDAPVIAYRKLHRAYTRP